MTEQANYSYKKISSNPAIWEQNAFRLDDTCKYRPYPTGKLFVEPRTLQEVYETHAADKMVVMQYDPSTFLPQYLIEMDIKPLSTKATQAMIDDIKASLPEDPEPSVDDRLRSLEKTVGDMKEKLDLIYNSLVDGK